MDKNVDGIAIKGSHYFENSFVEVVEFVSRGESYVDPSLLKAIRMTKDVDGLSQLTKREFEIFVQMSSGKSDEEIASDLSVDVLHVKNIRSKIARKTNHEHARNIAHKISANA